MAAASRSMPEGRPVPPEAFAIRWPSTMYSMNSVQLANANTKPSGWPAGAGAAAPATGTG
jgi:hypothetical protein